MDILILVAFTLLVLVAGHWSGYRDGFAAGRESVIVERRLGELR